jgi:hypothetical protein
MKRRQNFTISTLAGVLFLTGCIPWNTYKPGPTARVITRNDLKGFKTGRTTREEVVARLGGPDYELNRQLTYKWAETGSAGFLTIVGYVAWPSMMVRDRNVIFELDESDRVTDWNWNVKDAAYLTGRTR